MSTSLVRILMAFRWKGPKRHWVTSLTPPWFWAPGSSKFCLCFGWFTFKFDIFWKSKFSKSFFSKIFFRIRFFRNNMFFDLEKIFFFGVEKKSWVQLRCKKVWSFDCWCFQSDPSKMATFVYEKPSKLTRFAS